MTDAAPERCPLCAARALGETDRSLRYGDGRRRRFPLACASCGLLLERDVQAAARALGALAEGFFAASPDAPFGFDLYTLRSAALAKGLRAKAADEEQALALAHPHSDLAAVAQLVDLARERRVPISLAIACRPDDVEAVLANIEPHAAFARDAAILVDGAASVPAAVRVPGFAPGAVRIARRPLNGDFAAQRNALQEAVRADWVLQLDSDETLAPGLAERLPLLAGLAETDGLLSVGMTRRNLVGGVLCDVFPDVQYRLNRREVRYAGLVHERPERPWQRSLLVPGAGIEHHLSREHVLSRSRAYERMAPGRGRPEEERDLLTPYRD